MNWHLTQFKLLHLITLNDKISAYVMMSALALVLIKCNKNNLFSAEIFITSTILVTEKDW